MNKVSDKINLIDNAVLKFRQALEKIYFDEEPKETLSDKIDIRQRCPGGAGGEIHSLLVEHVRDFIRIIKKRIEEIRPKIKDYYDGGQNYAFDKTIKIIDEEAGEELNKEGV